MTFTTLSLRHKKSYWVSVEQFSDYRSRCKVEARLTGEQGVDVLTDNIRTFSLGPVADREQVSVSIDDQFVGYFNLINKKRFQKGSNGTWVYGEFDLSKEKYPEVSGSIGDLFF